MIERRFALPLLVALVGMSLPASAADDKSSRDKRLTAYGKGIGNSVSDLYRAAASLKLKRPVDEYQAWLLSNAYFLAYVSGCGSVDLPRDLGKEWLVGTHWGAAARIGPDIHVDKATGATYAKGKVKITDPKTYRKLVKH